MQLPWTPTHQGSFSHSIHCYLPTPSNHSLLFQKGSWLRAKTGGVYRSLGHCCMDDGKADGDASFGSQHVWQQGVVWSVVLHRLTLRMQEAHSQDVLCTTWALPQRAIAQSLYAVAVQLQQKRNAEQNVHNKGTTLHCTVKHRPQGGMLAHDSKQTRFC